MFPLLIAGAIAASEEDGDIVGTRVDLVPAADLKPNVRERAGRDLVAL